MKKKGIAFAYVKANNVTKDVYNPVLTAPEAPAAHPINKVRPFTGIPRPHDREHREGSEHRGPGQLSRALKKMESERLHSNLGRS